MMDWDELRGIRQGLLKEMDIYQLSIPYDSLTVEQKTELAQYRTDLLDLPQNHSTPEEAHSNIPSAPTWFN